MKSCNSILNHMCLSVDEIICKNLQDPRCKGHTILLTGLCLNCNRNLKRSCIREKDGKPYLWASNCSKHLRSCYKELQQFLKFSQSA